MDNVLDPIAVAVVPDSTLAGMYAELLRREGIQTAVQSLGPGSGGWGGAGSMPHRIFVAPEQYDTARAILDDTFGDEYLTSPEPD